jgi:hypothetical protein
LTRGTTQNSLRDARRLSGEAAVAEPAPFDAVTITRRLDFRSSRVTVYVELVSPSMSAHEPPEWHRCQRYAYESG